MATVASPTAAHRPPGGTQKRLLRSISRFLSGNKTRPKLEATAARTSSYQDENGLPEPVAGGHVSIGHSQSRTTGTESTGSTGNRHDEDDDDDDTSSRLSAASGADTDASVHRIPASTAGPPSTVSRADSTSNASFAPTHHTFKSFASTKPTTPSLDSGGANRIAVASAAPLHPTTHAASSIHAIPASTSFGSLTPETPSPLHAGTGPGITFSALPASIPSTPIVQPSTPTSSGPDPMLEAGQVPRHTLAHPRNNPHPSAPPPDNASMLTLASSSFAPSLATSRGGQAPVGAAAVTAAAGSSSSWGGGGLPSLRAWKRGEDGVGADEDASVRVLAGSRRASDESLGGKSTWSAPFGRFMKEGAPSVRTVGTTGTGGDALGGMDSAASEHHGGESLELQAAAKRASMQSETEAQRVVRKEGARNDRQLLQEQGDVGDKASTGAVAPSMLVHDQALPHMTAEEPSDEALAPRRELIDSRPLGSATETDEANFVDARSE